MTFKEAQNFKSNTISFVVPGGKGFDDLSLKIKTRRQGIGYSVDIFCNGERTHYKVGRNRLMIPTDAIGNACHKWCSTRKMGLAQYFNFTLWMGMALDGISPK